MKLAVSNIAWSIDEELAAAQALAHSGVKYIELAPTKQWPDLDKVPAAQAAKLRRFWEDHGFEVVALQAILFGHPELTLFDSPQIRTKTLNYLTGTFHLAAAL